MIHTEISLLTTDPEIQAEVMAMRDTPDTKEKRNKARMLWMKICPRGGGQYSKGSFWAIVCEHYIWKCLYQPDTRGVVHSVGHVINQPADVVGDLGYLISVPPQAGVWIVQDGAQGHGPFPLLWVYFLLKQFIISLNAAE